MKAIVKEKPGKGFKMKDVPVPDDLAPNEALVKINKASICGTDLHIYEWNEWAQQNIKPPQRNIGIVIVRCSYKFFKFFIKIKKFSYLFFL